MTDEEQLDEVDQMMEDGLAALEDEQYEVAAELFRRVIQAAPFRHDARDYLAMALDQQFASDSGRPTHPSRSGALGMSSAAAASTSHSRPIRMRVPMWLVAGACAVALFCIVVFVIFPRLNFGAWFESWAKKSGSPAKPSLPAAIAAEIEKADSAMTRKEFDAALTTLQTLRESNAAASLAQEHRNLIDDRIGEAYAGKARVLIDRNNFDRALEAAEQGLTYDPESAQLSFLAGWCYERKAIEAISDRREKDKVRFYTRAVEALEKSLQKERQNVEALRMLADCYIKLSRQGDAVKTWKRIIDIAPTSPEAERAKDYLGSLGFPDE